MCPNSNLASILHPCPPAFPNFWGYCPNPGIPPFSNYPLNLHPFSASNHNPHTLISIPLLQWASPPFLCAFWSDCYVCNNLSSVNYTFNLLLLYPTCCCWIQEFDSASPAAFSHCGLRYIYMPRPSKWKGNKVGPFQVLPTPPSLSSFETHCAQAFSPLSGLQWYISPLVQCYASLATSLPGYPTFSALKYWPWTSVQSMLTPQLPLNFST